MRHKKASASYLTPIIAIVGGFMVLAILFAVNFSVTENLETALLDESATRTNATNNENATYLVGVANTLTNTPVVAVSAVMNDTVSLPASNYSASGNTVTLLEVDYNNTQLKVNYTWTETYIGSTLGSNATAEMASAAADIPAWLPVIVVVIVAVTVIGLLKMFKFF